MSQRLPTRVSAIAITCEIYAPNSATANALSCAARLCAERSDLILQVHRHTDSRKRESQLILQLPAEETASQHPALCLACQLAAFCPFSRVSVLVSTQTRAPLGETAA